MEEVMVRDSLGNDTHLGPLEPGTRPILLDRSSFEQHGGTWENEEYHAFYADGRQIEVCRTVNLSFRLWRVVFVEQMIAVSKLPFCLLLGI